MLVIAALLPITSIASLAALLHRVRPRAVALNVVLAVAVFVAWAAVALNVLSWMSAVGAPGVIAAELVPIAGWFALSRGRAAYEMRSFARRLRSSFARLGIAGFITLPLLALVATSAARYAPQNWDSMTYHLARVAHWIQNASVGPYRTHVPRQNVLGPGAEYLLLVLQVVARSDHLANFVQFACYAVLAWSVPSLARLGGTPFATARWLAPVSAAVPMAVLQASTTQNDLVAAVIALGLVSAATPFLHGGRRRWRLLDACVLGVAGAAAFLVKLTSLLVAAPVLVLAAVQVVRSIAQPRGLRAGRSLAVALAVTGVVAGPYVLQVAEHRGAGFGGYVYPLLGMWGDRVTNVLRGTAHHVPVSASGAETLGIAPVDARAWPHVVLERQEDYVGNPGHITLMALLLVVGALRWRRLTRLSRASVAAAFGGWVLVHVTLTDNIWFSRLQTPLFMIAPALLVAALPSTKRAPLERESPRQGFSAPAWVAPAVATLLLGYAYFVALRSATRPPLDSPPWAASRAESYYVLRPGVAPEHNWALALARDIGCRRIGLYIDGDSYDYPLTWRAMERGIEVRHVFFDSDAGWPCITVSDRGSPPASAIGRWVQTSRAVYVSPLAFLAR